MTETASSIAPRPIAAAVRPHVARRVLRNPAAVIALAYVAILVFVAIASPLFTPFNPEASVGAGLFLQPPGGQFLLGTDGSSRDILSRLMAGTSITLLAALLALAVAFAIGVTSGLIAGYYGGWFNHTSLWFVEFLIALPNIVLLLAVRAAVGPSVWISMAVFGVLMSANYYRLVYAAVVSVRNELYVDAARVSGLSDFRIIGRHVLAVVRGPVIVLSATIFGVVIIIQSGLEFIGVGDMSTPSWGGMLNDAFTDMYRAPLQLLWPSLIIVLTTLALTFLANAIRDELELSTPRRKRARRASPLALTPADTMADASVGEVDSRAILQIRGLRVGYVQGEGSTKEVVHGVTMAVRKGEVHGLIGESGSGKSQTAFSILGILPEGGEVIGGSIIFDGTELVGASADERRRLRGTRIGYIPQEPMSNLDPSFTIGSQLTEPLRVVGGLSKKAAHEKAVALLARVRIPEPERIMSSYPHQISGGMAQRVLIAGAVACDPDLLIADEPTTALDVTVQAEVLDLLRDLQAERDMGVLLVTHNFGVVADLCDRVSVMKSGRIVETGEVRALLSQPEHPYTRELLGAILDPERSKPLETIEIERGLVGEVK